MLNILDKANIKVKKNNIITDDVKNLCTIFENEKIFQINFESKGCKNSYHGKCIMCDYGRGRNITKSEMIGAFNYAINNIKGNPKTILVNTYGSILDEFEFNEENLIELLFQLNKCKFETIIFETHYKTITENKIKLIKKYIKEKNIYFEIGIESFNPQYRKYCLNKIIDNEELFETINIIKKYKCYVSANILVGIPFLNAEEQIQDVVDSISIAFENKIDEITLFPINIKNYTLLYELYKYNLYEPISFWMVIEILNRIPKNYYDKITFAWFGNRDMIYSNNTTIFPKSCDKCYKKLIDFFEDFNNLTGNKKQVILNNINEISNSCDCKKIFLEELKEKNISKSFEERIKEYYEIINKKILKKEN